MSTAGRDMSEPPDEGFYTSVEGWRDATCFDARERLTIEFAERFAEDHLGLAADEELWQRLHEQFSDEELVDLAMCVASWIGFGRLARVFAIDGACRV